MIELKHASVSYLNGVQALTDVSLKIQSGEFVFVVGPTGAGKSTFLKLLLAEHRPSSGSVVVDGQDLSKIRRSHIPALRRKLGVVFQDFQLLPDRSVYENVAFALYVTGVPRRKVRSRVTPVLDQVGLWDRRDALPTQLSGGEQQRVSIARALVTQPLYLIADEPTGNLDPDTSWEIMTLLDRVNAKGTTVLVATHDQAIVDRLHRRVLAFEGGRLVRDQSSGYAIPKISEEAVFVR